MGIIFSLLPDWVTRNILIGVAAAFLTIISLFAIWWFVSSPVERKVSKAVVETYVERPRFDDDLTFVDSSGSTTTREKPDDANEVEQTITVEEDSTQSVRRLFVEQSEVWFPGLTGRPTSWVRGLAESDTRAVTVTTQTPPLLGTDWTSIFAGASYRFPGGAGIMIGYLPLRVWAFRVGPVLHVSGREQVGFHGGISIEVRSRLYLIGTANYSALAGGENPQVGIGISYRF